MKLIAKIFAGLLLIYGLVWVSALVYFNYAERHKELLESNLSSLFDRQVSIQSVRTAWSGVSPLIQISKFQVAGDTPEQPALAFESLSAKFSLVSIFRFWPKLTEFAVEQPQLEIVSLPNNRLQIAGIELRQNNDVGINPRRLISWLLNHQNAVWLDGEIVWRHRNGDIQRYQGVSFVYDRQQQERSISAAMRTSKGPFAFKAQSRGDILAAKNWDASFEVLGDQGRRLIAPEDISLNVDKGVGNFQLKTLDVLRIREFLLLTGLGEAAKWVLDAQLTGVLSDVEFTFSGPFLAFDAWSLKALASEVGFRTTDNSPGMSGLFGKVDASLQGGIFEFSTDESSFSWPSLFARDFPIERAAGQFRWASARDGKFDIYLERGEFEDAAIKIWDINAHCNIDTQSRNILNLAQWFEVDSVKDLSYEGGEVVSDSPSRSKLVAPLRLDADAKFSVKTFAAMSSYLPRDPRLDMFRTWAKNAFVQGSASNGKVSYHGEVSRTALDTGQAQLLATTDFQDVVLDYGAARQWPKLLNASGQARLDNDLLTISPQKAWMEEDEVFDATVTIASLYSRDRVLNLQAATTTTLPKVMDFLFDGPLLKPELRGQPLPVTSNGGQVDAQIQVTIPLSEINSTTVAGSGRLTQGNIMLPPQVPMNNVSADINFTERSVSADNITADFLNGKARARLVTTQEAQPPVMRVMASGNGEMQALEPWLGEHVLSLINGRTDWQGSLDIDGPSINIAVDSALQGVSVTAPAPLHKNPDESVPFELAMQVGNKKIQQQLSFTYGDHLQARFNGNVSSDNNLLDNSLIRVGDSVPLDEVVPVPGVNFLVDYTPLDLDNWLSAVIDLAKLPVPVSAEPDTAFLDAMRSVKIIASDAEFLGRPFGAMDISAISMNGSNWIGSIGGDNISGSMNAEPRTGVGQYEFTLDKLHVIKAPKNFDPPTPIDKSLEPAKYPKIELQAKSFHLSGKRLGALSVLGEPQGDVWRLKNFELVDQGIRTTADGLWSKDSSVGSLTQFAVNTVIDEAGEVLDELQFEGLLKKGNGNLEANFEWKGAPHEFDFARLNGDYDFHIDDGELVKVEPGTGKLIGLLNSNAIFRRLTLDFRDVFSGGLKFDRMRFSGLLASGEAIMRDAYLLTPSVFVQIEGKLNLDEELIDMEFHASPELGGNLALLSALANPAAGAVVFITQKIFQDEMRSASFIDYRALGTWEDFEIVEIDTQQERRDGVAPDQVQVKGEAAEPNAPAEKDAQIVQPLSKLTNSQQ